MRLEVKFHGQTLDDIDQIRFIATITEPDFWNSDSSIAKMARTAHVYLR